MNNECQSISEARLHSIEHERATYYNDELGQFYAFRDGMLCHQVQIIITEEQMDDLDNGIVNPLNHYSP